MAKKKRVIKKKETAGDSRLPIADDAYRPFEEIKKVIPEKIERKTEKKHKPEPVSPNVRNAHQGV